MPTTSCLPTPLVGGPSPGHNWLDREWSQGQCGRSAGHGDPEQLGCVNDIEGHFLCGQPEFTPCTLWGSWSRERMELPCRAGQKWYWADRGVGGGKRETERQRRNGERAGWRERAMERGRERHLPFDSGPSCPAPQLPWVPCSWPSELALHLLRTPSFEPADCDRLWL